MKERSSPQREIAFSDLRIPENFSSTLKRESSSGMSQVMLETEESRVQRRKENWRFVLASAAAFSFFMWMRSRANNSTS